MVRLALSYAVPIVFAPPLGVSGEINGATGSLLRLKDQCFLVTASHVLAAYEKRRTSGEKLNWQVGCLPPFDPVPLIAFRSDETDILLLRLAEDDAKKVGASIATPVSGWPPPGPIINDVVLVAGYPKILREVAQNEIRPGYLAAMFRILSVGEGYFHCNIGHGEDLVSFTGEPLPAAGTQMGGLSGGPVFAIHAGPVAYPALIGVVSECLEGLEVLRVATLGSASISNSPER